MPGDDEAAPVIVITAAPGVPRHPTTASLVVGLQEEGVRVVVTTPVRAYVDDAGHALDGDTTGLAEVSRLTGGVEIHEPVLIRSPLPAVAAAAATGTALPPVVVQAALIARLARRADVDLVIVEDAEGPCAPIDQDSSSLMDVLEALALLDIRIGIVLACGTRRDDLAGAALTVAALHRDAETTFDLLGYAVTGRPDQSGGTDADPVAAAVIHALAGATGLRCLGSIPAGAEHWEPQQFQDRAGAWLPLA